MGDFGHMVATIGRPTRRHLDAGQLHRGPLLLHTVTVRCRTVVLCLHSLVSLCPVTATGGFRRRRMNLALVAPAPQAQSHQRPLPAAHVDLLDFEALRKLLPVTRRSVTAGQTLFRAGQPFRAVYLVHAGFFKTCIAAEDGRERTTGFPIRGDLLGIESIGTDTYSCDAVALDSGEVWELPYPPVISAGQQFPALQARLNTALASLLRHERAWALALGTLGAEARVALFLLDLAARQHAIGFSDRRLVLRMTRAEIGSFLGLQLETVARGLSHMAARGIVEVKRRDIELLDLDALYRLAGRAGRAH
jgi:CRP/FNR family transcriptional regulator, anaerobic regulatory protein